MKVWANLEIYDWKSFALFLVLMGLVIAVVVAFLWWVF